MARLADWLARKHYVRLLNVRRIFNSISQLAPALVLAVLVSFGCNTSAVVALLVIGLGLNGALSAGHFSTLVDIAPSFAGTLFGVTNTSASLTILLTPLLGGAITRGNQSWEAWGTVFGIGAAGYTVMNLVYVLTVRSDPQPWGRVEDESEETPPGEEGK